MKFGCTIYLTLQVTGSEYLWSLVTFLFVIYLTGKSERFGECYRTVIWVLRKRYNIWNVTRYKTKGAG